MTHKDKYPRLAKTLARNRFRGTKVLLSTAALVTLSVTFTLSSLAQMSALL